MLIFCLGFVVVTVAGVLFAILEHRPFLLGLFDYLITIAQAMFLGAIFDNMGVAGGWYRLGMIMIVMLPLMRLTDLIAKKYKKGI